MDIKQVLKDFGLDESEIKMYLAGLKTGEAPLSEIAEKAGIKRGSAYLIAKNLEEKGLMGNFKMRSGLRFVVSSPDILLHKAERKFKELNEIVPELKAIQKGSSTRPSISVFEGKEGYLTVFQDSLDMYNETIRAIGSLEKFYDVITYEYDNNYYIPERVRRRIKFKGLYTKDKSLEKFSKERDQNELREMRFMPKEYNQSIFKMIYRDRVVTFTSKKELVVVKVISEDIAESEKARFDLLWKLLG